MVYQGGHIVDKRNYTVNKSSPKALPCGIPPRTGIHDEKEPLDLTLCK